MTPRSLLGVACVLLVSAACSSTGGGGADTGTGAALDVSSTADAPQEGEDAAGAACDREGFVPTSESATAPETGLLYVATTSEEYPNDRLVVQIFDDYDGPSETGTYRLEGVNYADCGLCLLLYQGCQDATVNTCERVFYAEEGTVNLTALGDVGERFAGALRGVVFEEVSIDPSTFVSTPIALGETWCAENYTFDLEVSGATSSCGAAGQVCLGDEITDFELQSCKTGEMVSMFSLLGRMKALWLVLTSGWCGACHEWVPHVMEFTDAHATRGLKTVIIYGENAAGGQPTLEDCREHALQYAEDAGRFYLDHNGASSFAATFAHMYVYPDASGSFGIPWNGVMNADTKEYVYADGAGVGSLDGILTELLGL